MDDSGLSADELQWLHHYAQDHQDRQAPEEILAKLERMGLLMRGWGGSHIVTARGQRLLAEDDKG